MKTLPSKSDPYSFTVVEAAKYIGVGVSNLRKLIQRGVIKPSYPLNPLKSINKRSKAVLKRDDLRRLVDENLLDIPNLDNI